MKGLLLLCVGIIRCHYTVCKVILYFTNVSHTVKPVFFACPLFREFREPGKFAKIMGHENLDTVVFQCSRKQKC